MPALLAIGFVNPMLLAGAGLAVVPIIIHLLARRQFRVVRWGAMHLLMQAERENRRRVRFEQWLLLALRCLAMGLLGLLFARPFVEPGLISKLLGGSGAEVQRIILLDDSASLAYRDQGNSDFDTGRQAFERLIEWLHQSQPNDPIAVYLTSKPDEPLAQLRGRGSELSELREAVRRVVPASTRAQPQRVMATIAERLRGGGIAAADLYILSDFQRSDWAPSRADQSAVFEPLRRVAQSETSERAAVRVFLIETRQGPRPNVAIRGVHMERPQVLAGQPALLRIELANFGATLQRDLSVELLLDGQTLPAITMEAPSPGEIASATAEVTFPQAGYHVLTVSCAGRDGFIPDDAWRGSFEVKPRLTVLLVNGAPSPDALLDEVYLLHAAIAPPGPLSSGIQVDVIDAVDLGATSLENYDVVALCNLSVPGELIVQAVERYVSQGGGLLITLGDSLLDPEAFNQAWEREGRGLSPLQLTGIERADTQALGWQILRTSDDPLTTLFPSASDPVSEYVRFRAFVSGRAVQPPASAPSDAARPPLRQPSRVLARYTDSAGSPALAACDFGRGRVLMFTSSVDLDWNDWPRSVDGSFVVTMLEAVQYLAARTTDPPAITAGEALRVTISPDQYEPTVSFVPPGGAAAPLAAHAAGRDLLPNDLLLMQGPPADKLGQYQALLTQRSGVQSARPVCVNLATDESDLAPASHAELAAGLENIPHEFVRADQTFLRSDTPPRREMWRYLLIAAVVTLILEHTLAWWFGGGRLPLRRRVIQTGSATRARAA